jgi:glyoxalase family protein
MRMSTVSGTPLLGIHHITALASDPQRNVDFYSGVLGLRLVKRTVNFDVPDVYHLYFGDSIGTPGSVLTFFPFPRSKRGTQGTGELGRLAFRLPAGSEEYWIHRLAVHGVHVIGPETQFGDEVITLRDPDGLLVEMVFTDEVGEQHSWDQSPVGPEHAIRGLFGAAMVVDTLEPSVAHLEETLGFTNVAAASGRRRYAVGQGATRAALDIVHNPTLPAARSSAGSIHHIAWRVATDTAQHMWQQHLASGGLNVTEIIDRQYFRSIYYREPESFLRSPQINPDSQWTNLSRSSETRSSCLRGLSTREDRSSGHFRRLTS